MSHNLPGYMPRRHHEVLVWEIKSQWWMNSAWYTHCAHCKTWLYTFPEEDAARDFAVIHENSGGRIA